MASFIRWAGSKKKLLPILQEYWSDKFNTYFEPFMGSAQLFFNLPVKNAILSDINKELTITFRQVKNNVHNVYENLVKEEISKNNFLRLRNTDPETLDYCGRAARFLYLNRFCFNGLYRTNSKGKFNVPFSENSNNKFLDYKYFIKYSRKLQRSKIICDDFENIIKNNVRMNDFVYLDPPYSLRERTLFDEYSPNSFRFNDVDRFSNTLKTINDRGAFFVISYSYRKEIVELFEEWNLKKVIVQRNIAGFSRNRRKSAEIIATNIF